MAKGHMKLRLNNEEATFNHCRSIMKSGEIQMVSLISYKVLSVFEIQFEERLSIKALAGVIMNFDSDCMEEYNSLVASLERNKDWSKPK